MQVIGLQAGASAPSAVIVDASLATINTETAAHTTAAPEASNATTPHALIQIVSPESVAAGARDVSTLVRTPGIVKLKFIEPGNNPRDYFDPKEMQELTDSVRVNGIAQAILIRPIGDGKYKIIAGERRYRAATAAHGDEYDMPVMIVDCTEEEADVLANIENTIRADMSPTEEGKSAAKILGQVKGDRDEAARLLSWSRSKLDSRVALMNCSEQVQKALNERVIKLGHAELFASLAKENQDKLLPAVIERGVTVNDLKSLIEKAASKLSAAIFDKTDCAGCQHNSSVQGTMFEACITDGSCTNSVCYKGKTEAALEAMKEGLKEEYPVIRIVRAGDNFAQVRIRAEGPGSVGEAQAEACRGCDNFGAAISAIPEHLGKAFKDQCFDPVCNQKKVAENIRAQTEAKAALAKATSGTADSKDSSKGAAQDKAKAKPAEVQTTVSEGDKVKEYRLGIWRGAMKKEVAKDYQLSVQYLIALAVTGNIRHVNQSGMTAVFERLTGEKKGSDLIAVANQVQQMGPDNLDTATKMLAVTAMNDLPETELTRLAKHVKLDLTKHWKMDAEFLNLFTKSQIELVAKQVGLDKALGDGFKKLFTEKKEPLIAKLLGVKDFDYAATIPPVLMYK
ncbi:PRTRC system ParB family protein [Massilia sp. LjRoot122]|uniref:PRTRC system ParB family protein n=1 Tax=Massilia sp. LjRoot122 TaxID=3342257 RepID=UPI003ECEB981